jgi:hypothetical protein
MAYPASLPRDCRPRYPAGTGYTRRDPARRARSLEPIMDMNTRAIMPGARGDPARWKLADHGC